MNNNKSVVWKSERLPSAGLLVELGPQRRKKIARLKEGDGALAQQIRGLVDQSSKELGIVDATEIVPVLIIYRRDEPDYAVTVI